MSEADVTTPTTPEKIERHATPPPPPLLDVPMTPETSHKLLHVPSSATGEIGPQFANGLGSPLEKASATRLPPRTPGPFPSSGARPFGGAPVMTPQQHRAQHRNGRVSLGGQGGDSVPPLPLQTFWLTKEQAASLPDSELRTRLDKAIESSETFERAARQFRSLAMHYKLQNNILSIETRENAQRREVESSITQREIERLIVDVMGYSDASINTEQIRRKLKRSKQRLKDMEDLRVVKDREIASLTAQVQQLQIQSAQAQFQLQATLHNQQLSRASGRTRPPPINTALASEQESREPMSALEILASQVLSEQMRGPASASAPSSSGEKRRRPSSSSTISAVSDEEDTLEEIHSDV